MSVKIDFTIAGIKEAIDTVIKSADSQSLTKANETASNALTDAVKNWYGQKGSEHWSNPSLPTHGPGRRKTPWAKGLLNWTADQATASSGGTFFEGDGYGLAHKITGGTIKAKNARALTIPMVPEAHGVRASVYSQSIHQLFRPKNKDYLAESLETGGIRVVYLLRQSVKSDPWPDAIPGDDWLGKTYLAGFVTGLMNE